MTQTTPLSAENIAKMADDYYANFPDLHNCARDWGIKLLKFHTNMNLDPDLVYWHDFDNAQNSSKAHTGQQHIGKPKETLTVTELVLRRFNTFYQVNFDLLDQMSGFYTVKSAGLYNETNEVPLAPSAIMKEFWATDFSSHYQRQLEAFLRNDAVNGRVLIKILFFSFAWNAYNAGALSHRQIQRVFNAFAGPTALPPTLEDLKATHTRSGATTVHSFTLGDLTATDILRIKTTGSGEILYMPAGWFRTFHNEQQMYDWVAEAAADEHASERLIGHFNTPGESSEPPRQLLLNTLERIRTTPWQQGQALLNGTSVEIKQDIFDLLFETVSNRLKLDARQLLTSNHELRKELFLVDLEAFMRIVTPMAPGDPAIAMVAVAAGSLAFGSHLAKAVHGKDKHTRQGAFRASILDALTILLDMPLLRGAGDSALSSLADLDNQSDLIEIDTDPTDVAMPSNPTLAAVATGEDLTGLSQGTGTYQGVYSNPDGRYFIAMDGEVYQVRYIDVFERWVIVDPINPERLTGSWPVQRDWLGRWELFSVSPPAADLPAQGVVDRFDTSQDFRDITQMLVSPNASQLMTGPLDSVLLDARAELIRLRGELGKQAQTFFQTAPAQRAPNLPTLTSTLTPKQFLQQVYASNTGLVINETPTTAGSCQFITKFMSTLKAHQVKTLYLQGLSKDLHQDLIDQFLETGKFARALDKQLQRLHNRVLRLDSGKYTFRRVLVEARRQGIEVKALDCAASLSSDGLPAQDANLAQRMRVYYAFKRIEALQSSEPGQKWLALTDQTLANFYQQTPGLANLTGTPSLRIKVVGTDQPLRFSLDPGEVIMPGLIPIKGDISLKLALEVSQTSESTLR